MLPLLVFKEIKVEGFLVGRSVNNCTGHGLPWCRWTDRWMEGVTAMAGWVNKGDIKVILSVLSFTGLCIALCCQVRETVVEGFEKMPTAFIGLFTGENTGKMVVKA